MYKNFNRQRNFRSPRPQRPSVDYTLVRAIQTAQFKEKNSKVGPDIYAPQNRFEDLPISEALKRNILSQNYLLPTPIQDQAILPVLSGRDLIGIANTGTGKTAAFLIPLVDKVSKNRAERVLIVTPTRELAMQIDDELHHFAKGMKIYSVLCVGGLSIFRQKHELRINPNFIIGTPGRLKDLIRQGVLGLSKFSIVVLDETDRMVDIGFINDIRYFISLLPQNRQSLFFSATVSPKVKEIIATFVKNPLTVSVKSQDTVDNISQTIVRVTDKQKKIEQLHDLLIQEGFNKVLIFGRTKWGVEKLANELIKRGFKAGALHGDKRQSQRQHILNQFKRCEIKILLATDVASRGLDIEDVSHVINYDLPASYDDYIHRIGRTGRANKRGSALTFVEN